MEEDWLTSLLDPESAMMMPAAPVIPMPEMKPAVARNRNRRGTGTYITPPSLRKNEHVPAVTAVTGSTVRAPVLAVKVVDTPDLGDEQPQTVVGRDASLPSSTQPPAVTRDASSASAKREKRSRKAPPVPKANDGYASNGESPSIRPRHSPPPYAPTDWAPASAPPAPPAGFGPDCSAASGSFHMPLQFDSALSSRAVADMSALMAPGAFAEMSLLPMPSRQSTGQATEAADDFIDEAAQLQEGGGGNGDDSNRRKVRHNLTERRRVDRMNQLFNKLFEAIEDTAPNMIAGGAPPGGGGAGLGVSGADGKPLNPARWSKADVLEGALKVIHGLRRQLEEERIARTLSAPLPNGNHRSADGSERPLSSNGGDNDTYSNSDSLSEADKHELYGEHMHMLHPLSALPSLGMVGTVAGGMQSLNALTLGAQLSAQAHRMPANPPM